MAFTALAINALFDSCVGRNAI